MTGSAARLHRWIFLLTAGLLYAAVTLRSLLSVGDAWLTQVLLLLLAWLALFVLEAYVTPRWQSFFPLCMIAQTAIVVVLLARTESGDYCAVLFGILSMEAMQRLGRKSALLWIALFTPLTALPLTLTYDVPQALAFAAIYTGVDVFLAFFTLTTRRAAEARARNQGLVDDLAAANHEIEAYSRRIERLAATRERQRLARELHDSVTQTVFGMNLTAQSAALLLPRDRAAAAAAQLSRLEELGQSALAEIRALGSELAAVELGANGFAPTHRARLGAVAFCADDPSEDAQAPPLRGTEPADLRCRWPTCRRSGRRPSRRVAPRRRGGPVAR
ncbi:MAG: histidine kinase [Thermoleophilia bacterium]